MAFPLFLYLPMFVCGFWSLTFLLDMPSGNRPRVMLGTFMLAGFFIYLAHTAFFSFQYRLFPYLDPLYAFSCLAIFPLFYLYVSLLAVDIRFPWAKLCTLAPALLLGLTSALLIMAMSPDEEHQYLRVSILGETPREALAPLVEWKMLASKINKLVFGLQIVPYTWLSTRIIRTYRRQLSNFFADTEGRTLRQIRLVLLCVLALSVSSLLVNVIGRDYFVYRKLWHSLSSLTFSTCFFTIGWIGSRQNYSIEDFCREATCVPDEHPEPTAPAHDNSSELKARLLHTLGKEQIYRRPDLRITDLAPLLHTNRTYLSRVINRDLNTSFADLINKHRVEYAKGLLSDKRNQQYGLNYIADQSGFASLNSFLRAFKKMENTTPARFRQRVMQQ